MSFFRKLFNAPKVQEVNESDTDQKDLSLDQTFVKNFIDKGGKFLYCVNLAEVSQNILQIFKENSWNEISCSDNDLLKIIGSIGIKKTDVFNKQTPVFVSCEHLIAENGSILFSSNQLADNKISSLNENFMVYATTSQIVKTKGDSLTGIKSRYSGNIPSNISAIKSYNLNQQADDFLNYGNNNAKNLYLLLFEDL